MAATITVTLSETGNYYKVQLGRYITRALDQKGLTAVADEHGTLDLDSKTAAKLYAAVIRCNLSISDYADAKKLMLDALSQIEQSPARDTLVEMTECAYSARELHDMVEVAVLYLAATVHYDEVQRHRRQIEERRQKAAQLSLQALDTPHVGYMSKACALVRDLVNEEVGNANPHILDESDIVWSRLHAECPQGCAANVSKLFEAIATDPDTKNSVAISATRLKELWDDAQ